MNNGLDGYRVVFVNERGLAGAIDPGTIAIAPSSNSWNDFGERILIELAIKPRRDSEFSNERLTFRGFFGFL